MGATWAPLGYKQTPLAFLRQTLAGHEIIADGMGAGDGDYSKVYYAAVRRDGEVVAYVMPFARQQGGILWRDYSETSLPYFYTAPAKVMAALTPTDHELANEWRAKVREQAGHNYGAGRLRDGMRVRFVRPVWGEGVGQEFTARKAGRSWVFERTEGCRPYRLRSWTTVPWEVCA